MMDNHRQAFKEEACELLAELETSLLELEERPEDGDLIGRVFRAMHTIKGSGAMFGFDDIAKFTHEVETVFDRVRNGELRVTKELVSLTLAARDRIRQMLDGSENSATADADETGRITALLKKLAGQRSCTEELRAVSEQKSARNLEDFPGVLTEYITYRLRFRPNLTIFSNGTDPVCLLKELRQMGDCEVVAQTDAVPQLEKYASEVCYTYWDIVLTTNKGLNAIKDVFIFVEADSELKIDIIDDSGGFPESGPGYKKLGDILGERGDLSCEDLRKALESQKRVGELLVEAGAVDTGKVESALIEQKRVRELLERRQSAESASTIRVASDRLDSLVNLVGELVTVQARLSRTSGLKNDPELVSIAEEVERLTAELRDRTMSIRMLPIGTTFSKFKRLVRDLSAELGKEVDLTTDGAETELDKTVIEKMNDPLVHLIRNSIDHGIERPEVREAAGKPGKGTIHLSASHSGAHVLVRIDDDGAGLDTEAIRDKAISKGLMSADAGLSEKELFGLVFAPGFSTAKNISSVSGRGVGMDVVKRAIDSLRGTIDIRSQKGLWTSVTLKLPLTLAIIEGLLVRVAEVYFVMPLSAVEECVELTREDVKRSHGRHMANVRGQIVPYIRLREEFAMPGEIPELEQIVIVGSDGNRVGFVVDSVIGEHQTVLKSLGRFYSKTEGVSGATILGDGTVALILDIPELIRAAGGKEVRV